MPDPSDQPTRKSAPPPQEGETLDAPAPPEPGTLTARTYTNDGDPHTASLPRAGATEPVVEPPGFVIVRELGSGGMGIVYEARQAPLNRRVALKVLRGGRNSPQDVIRFLTEAEAVAAITHPHVVQVYHIGQHAGGPFMALELLTGGTLSERLRRDGRLDPRTAAELVAKLAGAVQAAHDLGIVHRDLKPGNVLFDDAGTPKITDFGLAKKGGTDITRTQAVMGTPAYMAPEQARGEAKFVGPAADIWALGAILYECLTGKRAFDADDTWAVLRKVTDETPPAPRTHVPGLPRDLELIALKCLEKNPADRYPSAAALAADLECYLAGRSVSVHPAGPLTRATKWVKRNPVITAATVAVALALVAGSAVSLAFGLEAQKRGEEVAKANADLTRTNDDLGKANADLKTSRDQQLALAGVLKTARDGLLKQASELIESNATAAERGYLSDIALAHQLWKANDLRGMRAALERCPPDRRRWEWHYLNGLARPEREALPTDSVALALAYSPDSTRFAFLTSAGVLTVRDLRPEWEGKDWHQFESREPFAFTRALAFRPDGKELAFSVGPRTWVLDLSNRQTKELTPRNADDTIRDPTIAFLALGYTQDGRLLGAHGKDAGEGKEFTFVLRDVTGDKTIATLATGAKPPRNTFLRAGGAAFSDDGTRFAASVIDSGIYVSTDGERSKPEPFPAVLKVWEIDTGSVVQSTQCGSVFLQQLAFAQGRHTIGFPMGGQVGEVGPGPRRLFPAQFPGRGGELRAVAFDKNGLVWLGGEDKFIVAHDRRSGAEQFVLRGCPAGVVRLAVSPDGREVAAAVGDLLGGSAAVHRFDVAAMAADVWRAPAAPDRVSAVVGLSPDGARFTALYAGGRASPQFVLRDVAGGSGREVKPAGPWMQAAFRPDGGVAVLDRVGPVSDRADVIQFIDPNGKRVGEQAIPKNPERGAALMSRLVCYSPDGKQLVVLVGGKGKQGVGAGAWADTWDAATLKPGKTYHADLSEAIPAPAKHDALYPTAGAFDPTGRLFAATFFLAWEGERGRSKVSSRGAVVVWDATTGEEVFRQITLDPLRAVGFDPQGRVVAAGGSPAGGVLYGWDIETEERTLLLLGHTRPILAFAFGSDGRLATAGDRTVKVWDLASRREVLTLDGFAREVTHVAFTADGKKLIAATGMDPFNVSNMAGVPTDPPPAEVRVFRAPK